MRKVGDRSRFGWLLAVGILLLPAIGLWLLMRSAPVARVARPLVPR